MHMLAPSSASPKAGPRPAVGRQTQHLNGMPCDVGPPTSETALPSSSEGLERVADAPSSLDLSALSVAPMGFHAQHFTKASEKSDGRAKDVWIWFWPVESRESRTPLGLDEPILTERPKSPAVACRLYWLTETWRAYKMCDGIVTTLRNHLKRDHPNSYEDYLRTNTRELHKHEGSHADDSEPFHLTGLLDRLIRWIVSDDQASNALIASLYTLADAVIVDQRH